MVNKILGVPPGDWGQLFRKDMKKTIEIKLTENEIIILINGLTVRALSDNLDEQDKALARLNIIMKSSTDAHGDLGKTQDEFNNQLKLA